MSSEEMEANGGIHSNKGGTSIKARKNTSLKNEGNKGEEVKPIIPFYKLFSFADRIDIILMIIGIIGAIGNGISIPLFAVLFGNFANSFGNNSKSTNHLFIDEVSMVSLDFVYLGIGMCVGSALQVICWMITGERQTSRIRNLYLKTILRQEIAFFDKEINTGEVVERISSDTFIIQKAIGEKVGKFIQLVTSFVGGFIIAFFQGWLLSLVMMVSIPLVIVSGALIGKVVGKASSRGQAAYAEAAITVEQTINSMRTVASFNGEKQAIDKYNKSLDKAATTNIRQGFTSGLGIGIVLASMFCTYSLGIWYGGSLILKNGYDGGKVINIILIILSSSMSLGQASESIVAFSAGQATGYKMFQIINRKPEIDSFDDFGKTMDDIRGDIELKNVVFSYPTRANEKIFSGFSLSINSGMSIALVGESGSGKSTVISLIERFYDPQSGQVLIDGINLKKFQLRWIRKKIGLVNQEPVLFPSSIRENIAYGKDEATLQEIKVAAKLANASKFIEKMPQGFDTNVGDHGTQLSGGQKQRLAIARAILKDPRILLLDEATSALDAKSERVVQEALDKVMKNRTTIIVAHRLITVKNADMIVVIHQGSIVEKGSHSELIHNPNGAYSQLVRLQEGNRYSNINDLKKSHSLRRHSSLKNPSAHRPFSRNSSLRRHTSLKESLQDRSISRNSSMRDANQFSLVPTGLYSFVSTDILRSQEQEQEHEQDQNHKPTPRLEVPIRRLAILSKPEIPIIILGVILAIIEGLIMPIFGFILSGSISSFYESPSRLKKEISFWALMFLIFAFVSLITIPVKSYLFAVVGSRLVKRVRTMCFNKVIHMEVGFFEKSDNTSGAIGARLSTDAAAVKSLVDDFLNFIVRSISTLVAGLVIAFTASWQLSLVVVALVPILVLNGYIQMNSLKGFSEDAKVMYEDASQVANDAVGNIRTVVSFTAEEKVMELYKMKCEVPMKSGIREGFVSGIGYGVSFFLLYCSHATIFFVGAKLVIAGNISFADIFKVFFALTLASSGISSSSSLAPDTTKFKCAVASVFAILDGKSKIDSNDNSGIILEQVKGSIEFRQVNFTYPTRPTIQIFKDVNFKVHCGKVTALVGESGCGKSTAISLLQRFYDPDSGHIFLDGIDTKEVNLKWLRQQIGLVSQDPVLFNDTIRANIAYGGKEGEATESDIIASAEFANAHRFISGLEQGYDTIVGERGIQLSGGQKQRVAIARAILKEPKILLLDEATSALDAESERVVQDALERVMVNRTTIVVAHRLSTIKGADMIAVVKDGSIVEQGKHDSLINIKNGAYASLVSLHASVPDSAGI